ncbi:hypothetical protein [Rubeoparvulum massiliense]|uniref:hypothetical protein n=1 Tax=Rubeoparvulum massiliense TaxID=1631346 RepID=UPI0012DFF36F|nr:hypothetical protein [Rubeoparvulum massiliense]
MQWRLMLILFAMLLLGILLLKTMVIYAKVIGAFLVLLAAVIFLRNKDSRKKNR